MKQIEVTAHCNRFRELLLASARCFASCIEGCSVTDVTFSAVDNSGNITFEIEFDSPGASQGNFFMVSVCGGVAELPDFGEAQAFWSLAHTWEQFSDIRAHQRYILNDYFEAG